MSSARVVGRVGCCALTALVLATCAKPAPKAKPKKEAVVEPKDPVSRIKKTVAQSYEAICSLEPEKLSDLVTDQVVAVGFGPQEYVTDRRGLLDEARQELVPFGLRGETLKVTKSRPRVGLAAGEQSAWVWDFPRIEQQRSGRPPRVWLPRVTMHLVKENALWKIDAVHLSFGHPDAELYAAGAEKSLIAPADLGVDKGPNTEQAVGLARRILDDITVKVQRVSERDEVLLLGTDPGDVFEGGKAFKDFATPRLAELKKAPFSLRLDGGPVAHLSADGKTAWVFATVQLKLGVGKKVQTLVPFRAFWVFAEEGDVWNLVLEHQSLGLKPEQRKPARAEDLKDDPVEDAGVPARADAGVAEPEPPADAPTPRGRGKR